MGYHEPLTLGLPLTLLTSVHLGKSLHVLVWTSEVSVVGANMSLTMEYHGLSADLLYPGLRVRHLPLWFDSYARLRIPFSRFLPRSSVQGA